MFKILISIFFLQIQTQSFILAPVSMEFVNQRDFCVYLKLPPKSRIFDDFAPIKNLVLPVSDISVGFGSHFGVFTTSQIFLRWVRKVDKYVTFFFASTQLGRQAQKFQTGCCMHQIRTSSNSDKNFRKIGNIVLEIT